MPTAFFIVYLCCSELCTIHISYFIPHITSLNLVLFLLVKSLTSMVGVDVFMSILQLNIVQTRLICTLLTVDLRTSVEPHVFLLTFP